MFLSALVQLKLWFFSCLLVQPIILPFLLTSSASLSLYYRNKRGYLVISSMLFYLCLSCFLMKLRAVLLMVGKTFPLSYFISAQEVDCSRI